MREIILCATSFVALGFSIGASVDHGFGLRSRQFSDAVQISPRGHWFYTQTVPQDIILHILPYGKFQEYQRSYVPAAQVVHGSTLGGETNWDAGKPCDIYVPEGWVLSGSADDQSTGDFTSANDAHIMAHELMHCLRGAWHG